MSNSAIPTVAVLQFPGSNCESETIRALKYVNLQAVPFRWNKPAEELDKYDAYILPGGFTYEDRVRAGVIAAKEPLLEEITKQADKGKPILGICNGAQILLESGLLPGIHPGMVEMALANNYITFKGHVVRRGHHCGWVNMRFESYANRTPFTQTLTKGDIIPITVSHGEGRFVIGDDEILKVSEEKDLVLWRYCDDDGEVEEGLPTNPNGSYSNIAGICNAKGNVAALMPHPERAFFIRQVPSTWYGPWGEKRRALMQNRQNWNGFGPGYALFKSLAQYLGVQTAN